jgi:lipopolysaccharide export system permease protein
MPILWRYLLRNYLQVLALCIAGFISVLLITRFQNIARFASTGASCFHTMKFVLLQIPFILPLAIPVSCLISAFILLQRMSRSHELTALRTAGIGVGAITFPLLSCGVLLSLLNFTIVSEISPKCRGLSKSLAYQMTAINPLSLLQKGNLIKLKDFYIDMKLLKSGKYADDVCLITRNLTNQRLGIMLAKKLVLENEHLSGSDVTFISSADCKNPDCFDHVIIENQAEMQTEAHQLAQYLRSNDWNLNYDYLSVRMLQAKNRLEKAPGTWMEPKALEEIARRLSLGLAAFSFTLLGVSFGLEISRRHQIKPLLWTIGLALFYLTAFIGGKSIKHNALLTTTLYLSPHCLLPLFCYHRLKVVASGAE